MSFKPSETRSMVLKKGKVVDKFRFSVSGTVIPTFTEQLVKSLGKLFDSSLKDSAAIQNSNKELGAWLTKVDKSGLPGRFKAWIYQHSILPRDLWPMLIYAVPMTKVESLERKQGAWTRWESTLQRRITWANILQADFFFYKLSMIPCQVQWTSMSGGRATHLLAFFALEEAL